MLQYYHVHVDRQMGGAWIMSLYCAEFIDGEKESLYKPVCNFRR